MTLTGWEKIRNMHSSDFRSGQKGLNAANVVQAECRETSDSYFSTEVSQCSLKSKTSLEFQERS